MGDTELPSYSAYSALRQQEVACEVVNEVEETPTVTTQRPNNLLTGTVISVQPGLAGQGGSVQVPATLGGIFPAYRAPASPTLTWPFAMACSACCCMGSSACMPAGDDCGLCLYSWCCTSCALAEVSVHTGAGGLCDSRDCASQWCAAWGTQMSIDVLTALVGLPGVFGSWVWTCYAARTRELLQARYGLPKDELCCDATITTFLPCAVTCFPCAVYQQAYLQKHTLGKDLECCCYVQCCQ